MARVYSERGDRLIADLPERRRKLTSIDKNALEILKKYGELLATEQGRFFRNGVHTRHLSAKQVHKLVELGYCRIDRVGESVFAVFTERSS